MQKEYSQHPLTQNNHDTARHGSSPLITGRVPFWLGFISTLGLIPFTVAHAVKGDWFMVVITFALGLISASIAIEGRIKGRLTQPMLLRATIVGNIVVLLAAFHLRETGIFWAYPMVLFNYYMAGVSAATPLSTVLCLAIPACAATWATDAQLSRIVVTLSLTTIFAYIFSTNIERQQKKLHEMAVIDTLTGIGNRRAMEAQITQAEKLNQRDGSVASLVIFDIDFFKTVNDTHGHDAGDTLLMELTSTVTRHLRQTDMIFRYGGEEFVILAPKTNASGATVLAEKIRAMIAETRFTGVGHITISVGVAELTLPENAARWLKRADEALYRAKASGRNQVQLA